MHDPLRTSVAADLGSLASELVAVAATPAPPLAAGTVVAEHFVIEALIGRGGMGTVYRARDTRLGRSVALKLGVRGTQREATALARLAHPNVVAVYEVGDGFVAMELVSGTTARHWLAAAPRSWREIVALYAAVGRGLAAAHAAGLVHRDVKPENILVGTDGRARIADFGLASEPGEHEDLAAGSSPSEPRAKGVAGTPRYMAPEQRAGAAIDARVDQFALAVALYEALAGVEPFPIVERPAAIRAGKLRAGRRTPRRVQAVLARALAFEPERRWPTTTAFVAALERASRRRWPLALAAGGAVLALAASWVLVRPREAPVAAPLQPVLCAALSPELDAMWTPHARSELIAGNPQAPSTAAWLADVVDYQARAWPDLHARVCRDGVHDRAWSPNLLDDAARCLVERRAELARALDTRRGTAGEIFAAARAIHDAHSCGDPIAMARMARRPTGLDRIKLDEVEQLTAQADAANAAGDTAQAKARSEEALALAIPSGVALARAVALETIGEIELARHEVGPAAEHLQAAYFEYRSLSDQAQTYRTALMVTQLLAADGKLDRAQEWLEHARAEAERTGATPEKRATVDLVGAQLLAAGNKVDAAIAMIDRDLPRLRDERDPRFITDTINALGNKAMFEGMANRPADALATGRAALALQERVYGPDHPELLAVLETIGLAERDLGQLDAALATLGRAATIATTHLAATSPLRLNMVIDYALVLAKRDPAKARPMLEQARRDGGKALDAATLAEIDKALR